MGSGITALIIWLFIASVTIGRLFIKADKEERFMLILVGLLSMFTLIKNL